MTFYVTNQNTVVLVLMLLGAVSGLIRDIVKVKRRFVRTGKILEFLEDFICCVILTFVYHITVFVTNYGYVRWYEFAGLILGFALYRMTISNLAVRVISTVAGLLQKLLRLLISPIVSAFKVAAAAFIRVYMKLTMVLRKKYIAKKSERMKKMYLDMARNGFAKR